MDYKGKGPVPSLLGIMWAVSLVSCGAFRWSTILARAQAMVSALLTLGRPGAVVKTKMSGVHLSTWVVHYGAILALYASSPCSAPGARSAQHVSYLLWLVATFPLDVPLKACVVQLSEIRDVM